MCNRPTRAGECGVSHRVFRVLHMHLDEVFQLRSGVEISNFTPEDLHGCVQHEA